MSKEVELLQTFKLPYPVSNNVYYRRGINCTYISKTGIKFKDTVRSTYNHIKPLNVDIGLHVILHPKLTIQNEQYKNTLDLDNVNKCILDSLIGILYDDDKQVKGLCNVYGYPVQGGDVTVNAYYINDFNKLILF